MGRKFSFAIFMPVRNFMMLVIFVLFDTALMSQDIPLGTWRGHISYNRIHSIALHDNRTYAAALNGIMAIDSEDNSITTYSKLNGLTGTEVTAINVDVTSDQLLIAFENGTLDVIKSQQVRTYAPAQTATITGSKKINHISVYGGFAYLSTEYGVVIFDLRKSEVKETWRNLGPGGIVLPIRETAFKDDTVFLATANGILAGDLRENLLDFKKWKRFTENDLNASIQSITSFAGTVYAAINGKGLHRYTSGKWVNTNFIDNSTAFNSLTASSTHLLITTSLKVWMIDVSGKITQIQDNRILNPLIAVQDRQGKLWIGDGVNGLVSNIGGNFASYLPNGPHSSSSFQLKYHDRKMYLLPGGFSSAFQPLHKPGIVNIFEGGVWSQTEEPAEDLVDIDFAGTTYLASFGDGLLQRNGSTTIYNEKNSPLVFANPPDGGVYITAVEKSAHGLWVANYGVDVPLHLLKTDNSWESFSIPVNAARYPLDIVVDFSQRVWMRLNPQHGGGLLVFDPVDKNYKYLNDQRGFGELPHRAVHSLAVDREGFVWVGTDLGVAYFFDLSTDAIKPIFENRFLLKDDRITAIAVDAGNRKWFGTERGAWLFNPTGEAVVYNFTAENSPLLSNMILDIEVNHATGEVFFATDKGIISYRSDAAERESTSRQVKIFPNPVTGAFTGSVGITGLITDAVVKITDVTGNLIWQTQAHGSTATWNVLDHKGRRVKTGIYLVFAASPDGGESMVGKVAVID